MVTKLEKKNINRNVQMLSLIMLNYSKSTIYQCYTDLSFNHRLIEIYGNEKPTTWHRQSD